MASVAPLQQPLLIQPEAERFKPVLDAYDHDKDGSLSYDELRHLLAETGVNLDHDELAVLFRNCDKNRNGSLNLEEFQRVSKELISLESAKSELSKTISHKELAETDSKATLKAAIILLVLYWFLGAMYGLTRQGWSIVDSVYFVVVTMTTVGYGDLGFKGTWMDKVFGGCFVFIGVSFIGTAAGVILDAVSQEADKGLRRKEEDVTEEFAESGQVQFDVEEELRSLYSKGLYQLRNISITVLIGALGMMMLEDWDFADGFYWACVTMTTVGFGDMVPNSNASKIFTCVYILLAFGVIASAISFLAAIPFEARKIENIAKVLHQFGDSLEQHELKALVGSEELKSIRTSKQIEDSEDDPHVTRAEFVLWQLLKQGKLDLNQDIRPCLTIFDELDADVSGRVDQADIEHFLNSAIYESVRSASLHPPHNRRPSRTNTPNEVSVGPAISLIGTRRTL